MSKTQTSPTLQHDVGSVPWFETYRLVTGFLSPRPIAFVSTLSGDGQPNLAPFSFYTCVSANPLIVAFSPLRRGRTAEKKDTLVNIEQTREFVISTVTEAIVERMNETAGEYPHGVSEWEKSGLTPVPSTLVGPARVKESPINMECRLHDIIHFGEEGGAGNLVMGKVERIHIEEDVLIGDAIDPDLIATVGRMGGSDYTRAREGRFQLDRPN